MCGCGGGGGGCRGVRRGERFFAPTTDNDDTVYVVGHDDKGIQFNQREMVRDGVPGVSETPPSSRRGDPGDRPDWVNGNDQGEYEIRPYRRRMERRWCLSGSNLIVCIPRWGMIDHALGIGRDSSRPYGTGSRCTPQPLVRVFLTRGFPFSLSALILSSRTDAGS
jgi:hypothetical protein